MTSGPKCMRKMQRFIAIAGVILMSGCIFVDQRKLVEDVFNGSVGRVVDDTHFDHPHWINKLETGRVEYGFKSRYNGCSYAIEIDEKTRVILDWKYLSEPQLCWKHVPTA